MGPQSWERAGAGGGWREALASVFGSLRSACNTKMGKGAAVVQDMSRRTYPKPPRKGKGGYKSDAPEPPYSFLDVPNCFVSATEGIRVSASKPEEFLRAMRAARGPRNPCARSPLPSMAAILNSGCTCFVSAGARGDGGRSRNRRAGNTSDASHLFIDFFFRGACSRGWMSGRSGPSTQTSWWESATRRGGAGPRRLVRALSPCTHRKDAAHGPPRQLLPLPISIGPRAGGACARAAARAAAHAGA